MEGAGARPAALDTGPAGDVPTPVAVIGALKRILDSEELRASRRSRDFLSYVVTETLAGRGDRLKERTVARYAMGRDGSFSGATDSGARVQATRLRAALDRYYSGSGFDDEVVIELARGRYATTFAHRHRPPGAAPEVSLRSGIAIVALDDLRLDADGDATARVLSDSLVRALATFPQLRVVGPVASEQGMTGPVDVRTLARSFDVEYVLDGELLASGTLLRLCISVHDGATGAVVWSETFEGERGGRVGFEDLDDVVRRIAATVGDVRGVVTRDVERQSARGVDPRRPSAVLAFYRFADSGTRSDTEVAARELDAALLTRPDDSVMLAMAGWIQCYLAIMGWTDDEDAVTDRAEALASRALSLDPLNAHAHQVLAGVAVRRGLQAQVRHHVRRTVELSPVNASLLYTSGVLLIQVGDWDDGVEMIRESNRLNPFHPGYQHVFLGLEHLVAGDDAAALAEMSLLRHPDDVWGPFLRFLALAGQGYDESARHELAAALVVVPELLDDDAAYVTAELRDAPHDVRVELRRRVSAWVAAHPAWIGTAEKDGDEP
ncbi:MAG TPA: hypothetical protein VFY76_02915 [Nocardioides sp.]|nr:hypothetical protein [Nocardioides sp.]